MDAPARVLLIGNAQTHLAERSAMLRSFWRVKTVSVDSEDSHQMQPLPLDPELLNTDLVVVCETLPEPDRQGWVDRLRQDAPSLLVIKLNGYDAGPHAGADATVDEQRGPGALVATIYELLTERGLESRGWPGQVSTAPIQ